MTSNNAYAARLLAAAATYAEAVLANASRKDNVVAHLRAVDDAAHRLLAVARELALPAIPAARDRRGSSSRVRRRSRTRRRRPREARRGL